MHKHMPDKVLVVMAGKFQMLADPSQLAILRTFMFEGERNVGQVVEATDGTQANISKHLKMLAAAGLLARRKRRAERPLPSG
jgi:DNA-binding transcriptional ArsR family regulator